MYRISHKMSDLKQNVVNGWLDLEAECVAGIVLVENELVVNAEERQRRDSRVILWRHLVTIALHVQLLR